MIRPYSSDNPTDEVLRKIGRNIVNFQKIEMLLKVLVFWSYFEGTLESLEQGRTTDAKAILTKPMGQVAGIFNKNVYGGGERENEVVDPLAISMSFRFKLEIDAETATIKERELRSLINERNRLIHQELGNINFESEESRRDLIEKLDEQNGRIQKQLDELQNLWKVFNQLRKEVIEFINTDQFMAMFQQEQNGT